MILNKIIGLYFEDFLNCAQLCLALYVVCVKS